MKKALVTALALSMLIGMNVQAEEEQPELKLMNATAYCCGTKTYTGKEVREGFCAVDLDHVGDGWVAVIYQAVPDQNGEYHLGKMLYTLECEDTGEKDSGVRKGYNIDIYREDMEGCQEVMDTVYENGAKGKVFVQFVKGQG